jgi:phage terminase Nu1 subunit (DNA packaging protein)
MKQADEKIKLSDLENEKLFTIKLQEEIRLLSKRSEKVDINTKQLSGELIPKYEVLRKWQQTAAIIRTGVLSIAHKVKTKHPELELIYYNTIDNESRQILEELSHDGLPNGYQRCAVRDDADVEAST